MKKIVLTILLVLALTLFTGGCTSTTPQAAPAAIPAAAAAPVTPNLLGTWSGTMQGYEEGPGFMDYSRSSMSMVVTEQKGRIFAGNFTFRFNGTELSLPYAGVISSDGRSLAIVENANGYTTGTVSGDTIELIHMDDANPYSVAIDTLKRG